MLHFQTHSWMSPKEECRVLSEAALHHLFPTTSQVLPGLKLDGSAAEEQSLI